jgi:hypothetical protein
LRGELVVAAATRQHGDPTDGVGLRTGARHETVAAAAVDEQRGTEKR